MFFWNSLAFSVIQWILSIWSVVPLHVLNPVCTSGSSLFICCWSLAWRILSITLLACDKCNCVVVWTFFGVAFLWDWNENWPFSSPVATAEFSKFAGKLGAALLTASSFRIWNTSAGISSPPFALLVGILPKARLTSHFRMSSLGKWPHHCGYLSLKPLWISSIFSWRDL